MSTARSIFSYYQTVKENRLTRQTTLQVGSLKVYLLNQAEIFLDTLPKGQWVPIPMIPDNIWPEVMQLLDHGTITFREGKKHVDYKVWDNDDFSAFKLLPGEGTLKKEGFGKCKI